MTSNVLLIGGSGFVGRQVASKLVAAGHKVVLPTRRSSYAKDLWVLPSVQVIEANVHDPVVLDDLCQGIGKDGIVINLVGVLHDKHGTPYGPGFEKNHVELPRKIITAMTSNHLQRYIHMSALGADVAGCSMYQRSKGAGEALVKNSSLSWTIFRPSVIFGEDDSFINLFGTLQKFAPVMPLAGSKAKFQPVYVGDVAEAFVRSINMTQTIGRTYDLVGSKVYTLAELVKFAGEKVNKSSWIVPIPRVLGYLQALMLELMPGPTLMSRDNLASMQQDNVLPLGAENALEKTFGITPQPLEVLLK
jgi:NADH dehydrogenase